MAISVTPLNVVFALLILTPGFLTFKIARRRGKYTKEIKEFDKTIYTLIGSGAAFALIIIPISIIDTGFVLKVFTGSVSIHILASIYMGMLVVSSIQGWTVGFFIDEVLHRGEDIRKETVWELIYKNREEPASIFVNMANGDEIWGEVLTTDSEPHGQDILLKYPEKITRNNAGEIENREPIGDYVFISESEVSHVYYETEIDITLSG